MILTAKEVATLTGYQRPSKQIEWLRSEGFTFRIGADGHPKVEESHYLKVMGGTPGKQKTEPDFSSLHGKAA